MTKIKTLTQLTKIVNRLKKQGKKIVTTNGAYDLFHAGHLISLQKSKALGDVLIVGINSDKSVKRYKSPARPIIPQQDRLAIISALECVDYVFLFDDLNPIPFVTKLKPHIHTNSSEYGENCVEKDAVEKGGGKIHLIPKNNSQSTSRIINKILKIYGH